MAVRESIGNMIKQHKHMTDGSWRRPDGKQQHETGIRARTGGWEAVLCGNAMRMRRTSQDQYPTRERFQWRGPQEVMRDDDDSDDERDRCADGRWRDGWGADRRKGADLDDGS